jgi:hypothetical protein
MIGFPVLSRQVGRGGGASHREGREGRPFPLLSFTLMKSNIPGRIIMILACRQPRRGGPSLARLEIESPAASLHILFALQVSAFDQDLTAPNNKIQYGIVRALPGAMEPDASNLFKIDPNSGQIALAHSLVEFAGRHLGFIVEAKDGGLDGSGLNNTAKVAIHVEGNGMGTNGNQKRKEKEKEDEKADQQGAQQQQQQQNAKTIGQPAETETIGLEGAKRRAMLFTGSDGFQNSRMFACKLNAINPSL